MVVKPLYCTISALLMSMAISAASNAAIVTGNIFSVYNSEGITAGSTVDHWSFTVNTYSLVTIDTLSWELDFVDGVATHADVNADGEIAFFDTVIHLFADNETLHADSYISGSNDMPLETLGRGDGSVDFHDSFLSLDLAPGDYILAIGGFQLSLEDALDKFNDGNFNPATCTINPDGSCSPLWAHDHGDYQITFDGDLIITGDPGTYLVPVPAAVWLFGSGLFGLLGFARRKRANLN